MSRQQAWQRLKDFSTAHYYVPNIVKTEIISPQRSGLGARRLVTDKNGAVTEEIISEWIEGEGFVMQLRSAGKPVSPFDFSEYRYQLQALPEGRSRAVLTLYYRLPWGIVGEQINKWFLSAYLQGSLPAVAAGLKYHYETANADDDARQQGLSAVEVRSSN